MINRSMGRIAAAVWAAIALCGAVATLEGLRIPGSDVMQMRWLSGAAAVLAGISFVLPWARLPRIVFGAGLLAMSLVIAGLVHAAGSADSALTVLFTLVVALAASFLPVRASVVQLGIVGTLLVALVFVVGQTGGARTEVTEAALLLASLTALCGLVLVMRTTFEQRVLGIRSGGTHRFGSVLLERGEFEDALRTELSRAARHERPLSVMLLEVTGSAASVQGRRRQIAVAGVARAIVERIRIEDTIAQLDDMLFAVIAPETRSGGAAAMATTVAELVRRRLLVAGYDPDTFEVLAGWADFPHRGATPESLVAAAQAALADARARAGDRAAGAGAQGRPAGSPGPQSV